MPARGNILTLLDLAAAQILYTPSTLPCTRPSFSLRFHGEICSGRRTPRWNVRVQETGYPRENKPTTNNVWHDSHRLYAESFPHRRHPDRRTLIRIHQRRRENLSFAHHQRLGSPSSIAPGVENHAVECVEVNPGTSARRLAMQEGISASSVWRILHRQFLYPCHIQRVQGLKNTDFLPRSNSCQQIQHQRALDPHETGTSTNILVQRPCRNTRQLRLNGKRYLRFLQDDLPTLLDNLPLHQRQRMWFMHDGAPAHFLLRVRRYLNRRYGDRWTAHTVLHHEQLLDANCNNMVVTCNCRGRDQGVSPTSAHVSSRGLVEKGEGGSVRDAIVRRPCVGSEGAECELTKSASALHHQASLHTRRGRKGGDNDAGRGRLSRRAGRGGGGTPGKCRHLNQTGWRMSPETRCEGGRGTVADVKVSAAADHILAPALGNPNCAIADAASPPHHALASTATDYSGICADINPFPLLGAPSIAEAASDERAEAFTPAAGSQQLDIAFLFITFHNVHLYRWTDIRRTRDESPSRQVYNVALDSDHTIQHSKIIPFNVQTEIRSLLLHHSIFFLAAHHQPPQELRAAVDGVLPGANKRFDMTRPVTSHVSANNTFHKLSTPANRVTREISCGFGDQLRLLAATCVHEQQLRDVVRVLQKSLRGVCGSPWRQSAGGSSTRDTCTSVCCDLTIFPSRLLVMTIDCWRRSSCLTSIFDSHIDRSSVCSRPSFILALATSVKFHWWQLGALAAILCSFARSAVSATFGSPVRCANHKTTIACDPIGVEICNIRESAHSPDRLYLALTAALPSDLPFTWHNHADLSWTWDQAIHHASNITASRQHMHTHAHTFVVGEAIGSASASTISGRGTASTPHPDRVAFPGADTYIMIHACPSGFRTEPNKSSHNSSPALILKLPQHFGIGRGVAGMIGGVAGRVELRTGHGIRS
ncbi:hypothetical protein PR048_014546 [Dryococelus australis]|uniref:Uncharacterized protein n=1 Tax=Dryococelus australis TaxID=614101 RepID=A0ABQ9HEJ6_9NEOP|nr:hypothetical protein PR048_014546 [Dryococelus australis]